MFSPLLLSYQDEIHVKLFRIWYIIKTYGTNKKDRKILTIDKIHLLDFILQNEEILNRLQTNTNKGGSTTLYKSNLSYGSHNNTSSTIVAIELLYKQGFIEIEDIDDAFYCTCTDKEISLDTDIIHAWKNKIEKIKPLVSKPTSSINKRIFEVES